MKFKGDAFGASFSNVKAGSQVELYPELGTGVGLEDVRYWVWVKTSAKSYWLELSLQDDTLFHLCGCTWTARPGSSGSSVGATSSQPLYVRLPTQVLVQHPSNPMLMQAKM
jgi:hypothetical protein